ncbi:hypothetical protein GJ496_006637 [Pomphorhynchus laevis]|nr:hypothetical protein GJ496_006637 [Pomphorhynchus laevis]
MDYSFDTPQDNNDLTIINSGSSVNALRSKFLSIMNSGPRIRSQSVPCDDRSSSPDLKSELVIRKDSESLDRFRQAQELFKRLETQESVSRRRRSSDSEFVESDFIEPRLSILASKHHSPPRQLLDSIEASISSEDSLSQCIDDKLQLNIQDDKQLNKKTVQFSPMPTKIYETYSPVDYDRRNDMIDPIASSAEYELEKRIEKMDIYKTFIKKETVHDSLGFTIIGIGIGADSGIERLGMFIKSISCPPAYNTDKRLEVGDQIIEVNGVSLVGVTQNFASTFLKDAVGEIELTMGRETDRTDSEILKLINESIEMDHNDWLVGNTQINSVKDDDSSFCMEEQFVCKPYQTNNDHDMHNKKLRMQEDEIAKLKRQLSSMESIKQHNILLEQQVSSMDRKISEMDQLLNLYGREKNELRAQIVFYQRQCSDLENRYLRAREALLEDLRRRDQLSNSKNIPIDSDGDNQNEQHYHVRTTIDRQPIDTIQRRFAQQRIVPINIKMENDSNNYGDDCDSSSHGEEHSFPLILDDGLARIDGDLCKLDDDGSSLPSVSTGLDFADVNNHGNTYHGSASTTGVGSLAKSSKVLITGSVNQNGESNLIKYFSNDKRPSSAPPDDRIQQNSIMGLRIAEWSVDNVLEWLKNNNLSNHTRTFKKMQVDGPRLLKLDSSKLKSLGIKSSKERDFVKSKLKILKESESTIQSFKLSDAVAAILRPMKRS